MHKGFLLTGSVLAGLAVLLGAFGAHGLKKIVPPESVTTFETGFRYQFYHSIALLIVGVVYQFIQTKWMVYSGNCFIVGMILFSGSLYLLTLLKATSTVGLNGIGVVTPVGGLFFIAGWIFLTISIAGSKM